MVNKMVYMPGQKDICHCR